MAYSVRVKAFEGPLELLLNLIEARKLSINEISLGSVTEDYFKYLEVAKKEDLETYHEEVASFRVIAATLMVIKSRSLLPGFYITADEEADIRELEDRLKAYKAIKDLAERLGAVSQHRKELFGRAPFVMVAPSFLPPTHPLDLPKMVGILKSVLNTIPKKHELPQKVVKKIVSIEERIKELERRIQEGVVKTFHDFVGEKKEKVDIIVSFLAMLELIKIGTIAVQQSNLFGLIGINPVRNSDGSRMKSDN